MVFVMKKHILIFFVFIQCFLGYAQTTDIRLNQIGYYTRCSKLAIVKNASAGPFYIALPDLSDSLFTGTLSAAATWTPSNESVRVADFSAFDVPGDYVVVVPGLGRSFTFTVGPNVHASVNKASLKGFYYQRCGTALLAAHAGTWARAAGHITPDNNVTILPSAAGPTRVAGNTFASQKGWYDAGDYNKYIVNSGISTYTLLAAYEHYPSYYDTLNVNIPESGNALPDLLDEIKWNLDWMLTTQDPADGGVYNKVTNANFDGVVMPSAANNTRYFCAKGSAATFDFAAVMATAYRVYLPYNAAFATQCLNAAVAAYTWGTANPNVTFNNPGAQGGYPAINTGGYGDGTLTDEREWAATELYISTLNDTYYANSFKNANYYGLPGWPNVRTLGLMSLLHHRKNLTAVGFADTTNMKAKLFALADPWRTTAQTSAYRVAMVNGDFYWGSNGQAANQGMILLQAYNLTKDPTYFTAAISSLDYLNGRNATTFAFVTGHGDKTPMHIHHRPSEADGITDPVPGLLAGGPNTDAQGDCGAATYPSSTYKALAYQDSWCSYSTNEIAINWNAPYVYLSGAVEAVNPCRGGALPVNMITLSATRVASNVLVSWTTVSEQSNDQFIIQRSSDGKSFHAVGNVKGNGNTDAFIHYEFIDDNPLDADSYYRIVQVDFDGTKSHSEIVSVQFSDSRLFVYPNPSPGSFTVECTGGLMGEIVIDNIAGKNILKEKVNALEPFKRNYDLSDLPEGIYILSIRSSEKNFVKRIIIQ